MLAAGWTERNTFVTTNELPCLQLKLETAISAAMERTVML